MATDISIRQMIDAGVHFGHQSKYWNPKMSPYIYTTYKKLHIINLEKTQIHFKEATNFIEKLISNNSKILFVGTKRAARESIEKYAKLSKMPYVNNRWLGGMLTNFDTVKKSILKLENLKKDYNSQLTKNLTKKELLKIKKEIIKLEKNLDGIKDLEVLPNALFVVDTRYEKIAVQEANKLSIPVIALVDSNNSYDGIDYMIPANDDSISSIELFIRVISDKITSQQQKLKTSLSSTNNIKTQNKKPSEQKTFKKKQVIKVEPKDTKKDTPRRKTPVKKIVEKTVTKNINKKE